MLWNFEPWPELTADSSPWMNLGTPGAKYMRGAVIPMDTAGADITLTLYSSDGGSVSMGPFNSTLSEKSPEPWAFTIPLVGHEFQLAKSGPCRIWLNEIRWDFDPYPELINECTGWLKIYPDGGAALFTGLRRSDRSRGIVCRRSQIITDLSTTPIAAHFAREPNRDSKNGRSFQFGGSASLSSRPDCSNFSL